MRKGDKKTKSDPKLCKYRDYGCRIGEDDKKKAHKTNIFLYCKYHGKTKEQIELAKSEYLSVVNTTETRGKGKSIFNWCLYCDN